LSPLLNRHSTPRPLGDSLPSIERGVLRVDGWKQLYHATAEPSLFSLEIRTRCDLQHLTGLRKVAQQLSCSFTATTPDSQISSSVLSYRLDWFPSHRTSIVGGFSSAISEPCVCVSSRAFVVWNWQLGLHNIVSSSGIPEIAYVFGKGFRNLLTFSEKVTGLRLRIFRVCV